MMIYSVDIDTNVLLMCDMRFECDTPMQAAVKACMVNNVRDGHIYVRRVSGESTEPDIIASYSMRNSIFKELYVCPDNRFEFFNFVFNDEIMRKFGYDNSDIRLFQELSELQIELCKFRLKNGNIKNLVEEIAHVLIFIKQISNIYNIQNSDIQDEIFKKINKYVDRP